MSTFGSFHATLTTAAGTDITEVLEQIAECDWDFSGENGEDYLWEDAKAAGCRSNLAYLLETARNDDPEVYARQLIREWMERDGYYKDYEVGFEKSSDGTMFLALMTV